MTLEEMNELIEKAATVAGSQKKLADMLEIAAPNLIEMKKGKRPANWRIRGGLRAILGEHPARAFMAAMAEDLEGSELPDEREAAEGFRVMLALPDEEKPLNANTQGFDSWRKRMFTYSNPSFVAVFRRLRNAVNGTLGNGNGYVVFQRQPLVGM